MTLPRTFSMILFASLAISGWQARAQSTMNCSSEDGRRKYCPADTRGGVTMVRQRSGSPCRQGYSWGYDRGGVWVDRGCRADFAINTGYRPGPGRPGPGGPGPGPGSRIVNCSSENNRRNYCAVNTRGGVELVRQRSGSSCRQGYSWGYDRGGIWVDRGCRAEFRVR